MQAFLKHAAVLVLLALPAPLTANADGPDYYRVVNVAPDDVLNIRASNSATSSKVGEIPHDGDGIRNMGCAGGLSYSEWEAATQADRDAAARRRWCQISYDGVTGWVAGRFLAEGRNPQANPSYDCTKASGSAEEDICNDPILAGLDLELARLYGLAANGPNMTSERLSQLKATQRGWIKGRDACWKDRGGLTSCIADSYAMRIDQLRTEFLDARREDQDGLSLGPFAYDCPGLNAGLSFVAINVDPGLASLRWRETWITATAQRTGSGTNYQAEMADGLYGFWIKGDEAMLTRPGQPDLTCTLDDIG